MPRLSIYKPEKGNDYKFFDRTINEMFQVGGTDLFFHKYLGPYDQGDTNKDGAASPTQPQYSGDSLNERTIQDLLFLENRDRKYAPDIYTLRVSIMLQILILIYHNLVCFYKMILYF